MVANTDKMPRLQAQMINDVYPTLAEQFGLQNPMAWPRLEKIVINSGIGKQLENNKLKPEIRDTVMSTLTTISGQRPVMIMARKSVSNFKVREGAPSAFMVTLRRDRMWHFLDRLINLAIPRVKDFRGLPTKSFDKGGSYSFGFNEQAVFPEIDMGKVNFSHGMHINVVFRNSSPEISRYVMEQLSFPFKRPEDKK